MRVTTKGQVTIPLHIRNKLGITPQTEVDFVEEEGKVYLVKNQIKSQQPNKFSSFRGAATIKMTTEEILALTRGKK